MSRIRSIYPAQWTDEDFVVLSAFARLLALAIRNEADDNGVFEWKPLQIKMRLFPADVVDVANLLAELEEHRHVARFKAEGRCYGVIRNFARFNKPRRPTQLFPLPEAGEVPDEFIAVPMPSRSVDDDDEHQPRFNLGQPAVSAPGSGFPTLADNVRPEEREEGYIVPEDSHPLSNSESAAARARRVESDGAIPFGRDAPLSKGANPQSKVINLPDNPTLKARKKESRRQKVMRFINAVYTGEEKRLRLEGMFGADPVHDLQWWFDKCDAERILAKWDDVRDIWPSAS